MASDSYHEPHEDLTQSTKEHHRAIVSLMEELEAIDWYQQRADACTDDELRAVLIHNKNEEIEHAMMVLEWLRRNSPEFDANIHTYLLSQGPITEVEKNEKAEGAPGGGGKSGSGGKPGGREGGARSAPRGSAPREARSTHGSLGIGSLKEG